MSPYKTRNRTVVRSDLLALFCLTVSVGGQAHAQTHYIPDVAELDGTIGYAFPASEAFNLKDGATVEFWVHCNWDEDPGYDPVVLSNAGPDGALFLIAVAGDRTALSLQSGESLDSVPFDCTDSQIQHVAIAEFVDSSAVMINGRVVGTLNFGFSNLNSAGLWVGSADGIQAPFIGAIAGMRFWNVALDRGDLVTYSVRNVFQEDAPHPELSSLLAQSDFENDTMDIFVAEDALETVQFQSGSSQ